MTTTAIKPRNGFAAAAALVAMALASVQAPAHAGDPSVQKEQLTRCYGVNTCKGQSLCATAKHDCKGLNDCKGQGVVVKTASQCVAAGGTLTEPK